MNCAWKPYLKLVPERIRQDVEVLGFEDLLEIRLRCGQPPELVSVQGSIWLDSVITRQDLQYSVNIASQYSAWSSSTAAEGYITAIGGHRIGLCGQAVSENGRMKGIREPSSMCIRLAKELPDIAKSVAHLSGSVLIIGRPGSGKTTFLRDLIRQKSETHHVCVVDERMELFPVACGCFCFDAGKRTDVLSGCGKKQGIESMIRCMNPDIVAVDEITAHEDCEGLLHAGWCGVSILATAHAGSKDELINRPVYKPLLKSGIFTNLVIMHPDKTFYTERIGPC